MIYHIRIWLAFPPQLVLPLDSKLFVVFYRHRMCKTFCCMNSWHHCFSCVPVSCNFFIWSGCPPQTLAYGIDGWKCDAAEPYILEIILPLGKHGLVTRREYSEAYYADMFDYTRQKLGKDRLIMSRAVDGSVAVFPVSGFHTEGRRGGKSP